MSVDQVTAETLKDLRQERGLNQEVVAEILGVERHTISKIETGKRSLATSEKTLLAWFFFGQVPPRILGRADDLRGVLEFCEDEFRVITLLATRDGVSDPRKWIAGKIRSYLAYEAGDQQTILKVAESPQPYDSGEGRRRPQA